MVAWRMSSARGCCVLAMTIAVVVTRPVHTQLPAPTGPPAAQAPAPARLVGLVTDSGGAPLARAEIWHVGGTARTISSDSGTYELAGLPSGSVTLGVRRLGFASATFTAMLKPGKTHRANFPLTPAAQPLAEVVVNDTTNTSWLSTFTARKSAQRGTFLTRADFERRNFRIASDILRLVPGVSVQPTRTGGTQLQMTRGAGARRCVPQLYVHTTPYSGNFDDFTPDDIEALEVYVGISEIPPELNTMGRPICAAVVIWTRAPPPRKR